MEKNSKENKPEKKSDISKSEDFDSARKPQKFSISDGSRNSERIPKSKISDIENLKQRIAKLTKHEGKNKTDKSMLRCLLIKRAKLIKLEKFKKPKTP